MPSLREFIFGSSSKMKKKSTLNKGQEQFLSSLMGQLQGMGGPGGSYNQAQNALGQYLDPNSQAYQQFDAPYMRQFNEQIVPGLAERFSKMGANSGALSSSGFGQALGAAGAGLQENLASMRGQMQLGAADKLMNQYGQLGQLGLGTQAFGYSERPASAGLLGSLASNATYGDLKQFGGDLMGIGRSAAKFASPLISKIFAGVR